MLITIRAPDNAAVKLMGEMSAYHADGSPDPVEWREEEPKQEDGQLEIVYAIEEGREVIGLPGAEE